MPTREDVMLMPETVRVLDRKQLDAAGPLAGGAQVLQATPGANVVGYGETGATKYTVILNGVQQGWAGEATSFTAPGSLGITYDGIPVADPATGLWQSATMPQNLVMQDVQVTYGPGQAADRWYTNHADDAVVHDSQSLIQRSHQLRKTILQSAARYDECRKCAIQRI